MCLPLAVLGPVIGGLVSGVGSGVAGAVGSGAAADAQKKTAGEAMDFQREMAAQQRADMLGMYETNRADMQPWMQAGQSSLGELMRQMGAGQFDQQYDPSQLANDPGYQFRMSEGQKALERSASARGMMNSGGALKSLARYSQGVASDEYGNAWSRNQQENTGRYNRLANLAGAGQTAAGTVGQYGQQTANALGQFSGQNAANMGNLYGAIGNADAARAMGAANAVSGGFGALGNGITLSGMASMYGNGGMNIPVQQPGSSNGIPYYLARP